jgi:hypothetical protein
MTSLCGALLKRAITPWLRKRADWRNQTRIWREKPSIGVKRSLSNTKLK